MLAIQPSNPQKCTLNLLPCRINHNGPVNDAQKYFVPQSDDKDTQHAYFRGRHLHGTTLPLPEKYSGAVINVTDQPLVQAPVQNDGEAEDDGQGFVKIAQNIGTFDSIVVWQHGGQVEEHNGVVRGLSEWIDFAESMHCEQEHNAATDDQTVNP